jgi:hypothetical protein
MKCPRNSLPENALSGIVRHVLSHQLTNGLTHRPERQIPVIPQHPPRSFSLPHLTTLYPLARERVCVCVCTREHTHTHTRARAHACTHTHIHIPPLSQTLTHSLSPTSHPNHPLPPSALLPPPPPSPLSLQLPAPPLSAGPRPRAGAPQPIATPSLREGGERTPHHAAVAPDASGMEPPDARPGGMRQQPELRGHGIKPCPGVDPEYRQPELAPGGDVRHPSPRQNLGPPTRVPSSASCTVLCAS